MVIIQESHLAVFKFASLNFGDQPRFTKKKSNNNIYSIKLSSLHSNNT